MKFRAVIAVCAVLGAAVPAIALAQPYDPDSLGANLREQQDEARRGVKTEGRLSLAQVIEIIKRQQPGHSLDAGLESKNGQTVYRVRWAATSGHRLDYLVDAKSGAIVSVEGR